MKHFLLGSLSGFVLGGVYGLLKTPQSGKENQESIKQYATDAKDHLDDVSNHVNELRDSITNLTNEVTNFQEGFMPEVENIANEYRKEAEPRLRRINEKTDRLSKDIEKAAEKISE